MELPKSCYVLGRAWIVSPPPECLYKDSRCFLNNLKCITVYKETACKAGDEQYQCAQAYYQSQQNIILKQQTGLKLQQENTELKSQLQTMQKEIESLKTQQTNQAHQPQNDSLTASVGSVPMPYVILGLAVVVAIAVGVWKKFFARKV